MIFESYLLNSIPNLCIPLFNCYLLNFFFLLIIDFCKKSFFKISFLIFVLLYPGSVNKWLCNTPKKFRFLYIKDWVALKKVYEIIFCKFLNTLLLINLIIYMKIRVIIRRFPKNNIVNKFMIISNTIQISIQILCIWIQKFLLIWFLFFLFFFCFAHFPYIRTIF